MQRKSFTQEFKDSAVQLALTPGAVVELVARDLGIATWTLRRWMTQATGSSSKRPKAATAAASASSALSPARTPVDDAHARIRQLEREVATLRMERDILKKATAFFAAEDQKLAAKKETRH